MQAAGIQFGIQACEHGFLSMLRVNIYIYAVLLGLLAIQALGVHFGIWAGGALYVVLGLAERSEQVYEWSDNTSSLF